MPFEWQVYRTTLHPQHLFDTTLPQAILLDIYHDMHFSTV